MPGRADLFAQLDALDIPEAGAILPQVDLSRIGLTYLLKSAESRGLPLAQVQRWGSFTVSAVAANFGGIQFRAGSNRCLRVLTFIATAGVTLAHVIPEADSEPFITPVQLDNTFGRTEPEGLVASSVITTGRTTVDPHPSDTVFYLMAITGFISAFPTAGIDIPPGFVLEIWVSAVNLPLLANFTAIEIGP